MKETWQGQSVELTDPKQIKKFNKALGQQGCFACTARQICSGPFYVAKTIEVAAENGFSPLMRDLEGTLDTSCGETRERVDSLGADAYIDPSFREGGSNFGY